MESDKKLNLDAPDLLVANAEAVKAAIQTGIRAALLKHQQVNNPVAIWRNGKVVLCDAGEVLSGQHSS